MGSPTNEFAHVSQFYETMLGLGFIIVFVAQLLALLKGIHGALSKKREKDDQDYIKWLEDGGKYAVTEQPPSIEEIHQGRESSQKVDGSDIQREPSQLPQLPKPEQPAEKTGGLPRRETRPEDDLTPQQTRWYSLFLEVQVLFEEFLPIIMCVLVLGILTASTEVFSLAMFFCYVFAGVLFNYLKVNTRIKKEHLQDTTRPYLSLISGVFMFALFISYFIRPEFRVEGA